MTNQCSNLNTALAYAHAGRSAIPVATGTKVPTIEWKEYQSRIATVEELNGWFSKPTQLGIVSGAVSGGMEVIDFDTDLAGATRLAEWREIIGDKLFDRLVVQATGG